MPDATAGGVGLGLDRDVLVNVMLGGTAALQHGAAGHVCELQLVLLPFYERRWGPPDPSPARGCRERDLLIG